MDISKLRENIVDVKFDFRGFKAMLKVKPDADASKAETNAEYVVAKLDGWDITDKGNPVEISVESLNAFPPEFFTALLNKIIETVNAPLGK